MQPSLSSKQSAYPWCKVRHCCMQENGCGRDLLGKTEAGIGDNLRWSAAYLAQYALPTLHLFTLYTTLYWCTCLLDIIKPSMHYLKPTQLSNNNCTYTQYTLRYIELNCMYQVWYIWSNVYYYFLPMYNYLQYIARSETLPCSDVHFFRLGRAAIRYTLYVMH